MPDFTKTIKKTQPKQEQPESTILDDLNDILDKENHSDLDLEHLHSLLDSYLDEDIYPSNSFTIKTTKPFLDLLRAITLVSGSKNIKEFILEALKEKIADQDIEKVKEALAYKKRYLDNK